MDARDFLLRKNKFSTAAKFSIKFLIGQRVFRPAFVWGRLLLQYSAIFEIDFRSAHYLIMALCLHLRIQHRRNVFHEFLDLGASVELIDKAD